MASYPPSTLGLTLQLQRWNGVGSGDLLGGRGVVCGRDCQLSMDVNFLLLLLC